MQKEKHLKCKYSQIFCLIHDLSKPYSKPFIAQTNTDERFLPINTEFTWLTVVTLR